MSPSGNTIDISIVIVNYNGKQVLANCLDSVLKSNTTYRYEVIVVDNASTDQSQDILKKYDQVHSVLNTDNTGFSKANNQGAKLATGTWLFLLNNDTVVPPDSLQLLADFASKTPDIGLVGPKLLLKNGQIQEQGSLLGSWQLSGTFAKKVSFLTGAAMFVSRELYLRIGGFDENFVFYNEDVDLCKMVRKQHKYIYYLPEATIIHLGGESTKSIRIPALIEGYRGGLYLIKKHYPIIYLPYRLFMAKLCAWYALVACIRSLWRPELALVAGAYVQIIRIMLRGEYRSATGNLSEKK